jgi:hypothetical protein
MRTEETQIFKYEELTDAAKAKARDWWKESSRRDGDSFWSEYAINEAKEQGKAMGLEISNVYFSGFWSQGDGACFEGSWKAASVKAERVADGWGESEATTQIKRIAAEFAKFAKAWPESSFTVKHCGRYSHENCTDFSVSLGEYEDNGEGKSTSDQWEAAEKEITETAKDFMRWIYRQLEAAYEDYHADDNVAENIIANAYEFTADGKIY